MAPAVHRFRLIVGAMCLAGATVSAQVTHTDIPLPAGTPSAYGIALGADGNLWIAASNAILRMTPGGVFTAFPIPGGLPAFAITSGPDGNLWFLAYYDMVGRITPSGVMTLFSIGTFISPGEITPGPDGNVWFTKFCDDALYRVTPAGVVTRFPVPTSGACANGLTAGPDGNLWFSEHYRNKIGRMTPTGDVTEFPIGPVDADFPDAITAGPDGNLWFTTNNGLVERITPGGTITPVSFGFIFGRAIAGGGFLWFATGAKIGEFSASSGTFVASFTLPDEDHEAVALAFGPEGALWFTERNTSTIGRLGAHATKIWTGAVNANWSVAGNWTGGVPGSADALVFPPAASNKAMTNDLGAATLFESIFAPDPGFTFNGNPVGLTAGLTAGLKGRDSSVLNLGVKVVGPQVFGGGIFNGTVDVNGSTLQSENGVFAGPLVGTGSIVVSATNDLTIGGSGSFSGTIHFLGHILTVTGSIPNAAVTLEPDPAHPPIELFDAIMQGSGTVGDLAVTNRSFLKPGVCQNCSAVLHTANLKLQNLSSLDVDLNGATPGLYDQIRVQGSVDLGNAFLDVSAGAAISTGQVFTIIDNDGVDPVVGTFYGLPEGTTSFFNGVALRVSYVGGSGNDVTLTAVHAADLSVAAVVTDSHPVVGGTTTYTVTVTNAGPDPATNASVRMTFPPGLAPISSAATQGTFSAASGIWTIGTLNAGSSASLTVLLSVVGVVNQPITAVASADQADPATQNGAASTPIVAAAALAIPVLSEIGKLVLAALLAAAALLALTRR